MSDIVLSAGVRSNLLQLQQTSDLITQTQTRLATGKKVNSALDNAINFFTAQGLDNRANDLNSLLDSMSNGINTIQAANNGITASPSWCSRRKRWSARPSRPPTPRPRRALATQFDALLTQIGQLAGDSGFNGVNLLAGNTLTVTLDETGTSTATVTGVDYTNANSCAAEHRQRGQQLGQRPRDITAASTALTAALTSLQSESQTLSASLSTVQIRQDFTKATINTLQTGSADLTLADFEPGRRQPARVADPPATVVHRAVSRLAGRPERAAAVPLSRRQHPTENGGLRAAVFFRAVAIMVNEFLIQRI